MKFNQVQTLEDKSKKLLSLNPNFTQEQKYLIDTLVDPIHVISNSNELLKQKILPFVDAPTKEYFYMIERAQNRLLETLEKIRDNSNPKAF
ncbi:MAG: hypothetical protein DWQ18_05235 [Crenarchaeota archaeon]|nr:MAG: hypothetical protein DWQ17_07895 [Thermoproteota archaeon]RDJ34289.1 MAG: hypothetical protein DWQ18_05235 [Thermoproteota archaeon]RDJ36599.1 MAG: hypothetical protein DWQ13_05375 [Thermoproteota archaeon]RDJ37872.1 MAG: hypothetical protein DWQ19_05460 [Thermoproteota archaeon]